MGAIVTLGHNRRMSPDLIARLTPRRLLAASIVVAVLTITLKTLAWWVTGSVGLLSDAMESFVNLAGAMFALRMVTVAEAPPDERWASSGPPATACSIRSRWSASTGAWACRSPVPR